MYIPRLRPFQDGTQDIQYHLKIIISIRIYDGIVVTKYANEDLCKYRWQGKSSHRNRRGVLPALEGCGRPKVCVPCTLLPYKT
jgi:hypothetical protein